MTANYIDIKKFAVHDGPGIRTTLFFKGCPLKCKWCHNPESISFERQLSYLPNKCIGCGECVAVCPAAAHEIGDNGHIFIRSSCEGCGKCEEVCLGDALKLYGKEITLDEAYDILMEDKSFYETSGGGVTVSGGEPMMQADFVAALFKKLCENGVHTALDTCGYVKYSEYEKVIPYTKMFLYDLKHIDSKKHEEAVGKPNELILENLLKLDKTGIDIEIRIPFVPGGNTDEETVRGMGEFLSQCKHITRVKVLPYHSLAGSKYESLDMENTLPKVESPSDELLDWAADIISSYGVKAISGRKS